MNGTELINWIQSNHVEDWPVFVKTSENDCMTVNNIRKGEIKGGAIVLECDVDSEKQVRIHKEIADILSEVNKEKDSILAGVKLRPGEERTLVEIRRRYWAYLVRCLNKYHGPEGPYKKINTSKSCYLFSSVGIGNFAIVCEAKKKSAAVEVVLKKPDRAVNMSAFKYLMVREQLIRKALGTSVLWWAEDKWTYCYIHLGYKGVADVTQEDTWEDMAAFHMEWSRKFYDVFVPLLKEWQAG